MFYFSFIYFYTYICCVITKVKFHTRTGREGPEKKETYSSTLSLTFTLDGGGWSTPRPRGFIPRNESRYGLYGAGWAPGPLWTSAENFAPTRIRSPDRPARSESLKATELFLCLYI
jgi:hypothetical protein